MTRVGAVTRLLPVNLTPPEPSAAEMKFAAVLPQAWLKKVTEVRSWNQSTRPSWASSRRLNGTRCESIVFFDRMPTTLPSSSIVMASEFVVSCSPLPSARSDEVKPLPESCIRRPNVTLSPVPFWVSVFTWMTDLADSPNSGAMSRALVASTASFFDQSFTARASFSP